MKNFKVPVVRIGYGFATITVKANNLREAEEKALQVSGDYDYPEANSDYELADKNGEPKYVVDDIVWYTPSENTNVAPEFRRWELYGRVKNTLLFIIDKVGKRKPKYVLKSYPFDSGIFVRANNYKILYRHENLETVQEEAQYRFNYFVKSFLKQDG